MTLRSLAAAACIGLFTGACGGPDGANDRNGADTLSRAQRDSLVARLPVPGAGGVGAALRARDALGERAEAHDSIGRR